MIKFLDLQKVNAQYAVELKKAAEEVISSGWFLFGEKLKAFEKNLATYIGVKHVIGVANGLDALRLILRGYMELGIIKEGDEVIVPANTFIASILAITDNRLKPVLVEPDINTYNIDISLIEQHITERTRIIMVVHLYGKACWSEELETLANKYNLKIIEDNAQAIGAKHYSPSTSTLISTGTLGHSAGFSFYPGKNLGALGDGGAVITNDTQLAEIVRALSNYGNKVKYFCEYQGLNSRLNELQAAFLDIKLKYLDVENKRRREIAKYYHENINHPDIILPDQPDYFTSESQTQNFKLHISNTKHDTSNKYSHVWHLFVIRTNFRDKLIHYLSKNGIETVIHYPIPPHHQKAFQQYNNLSLPVTEKIHNEVLSLPMSPILTDDEAEYISKVINEFNPC